jgi:integrase
VSRSGSIKQAKDGSWFFVVDIAPSGGARKQVRRRGFRTKREAQAELTRSLHSLGEGTFVEPSRLTVQEWFETWLAGLRVVGLEDSTIDSYDRNLHNHVLPTIGAVRLQRLTPVDLDRLYARLLSKGRRDGRGGLSAKTVRYISTTIGKALSDAEKKGLVARNVARAATAPSAKAARAPEMKFWTPPELSAFLAFVADDELFALYRLASMTGARRGEICGVRWDDVDLDAGRITIRRQRISIRRQPVDKDYPKTNQGRRSIDLDPETVTALRSHRVRQAERRLALGLRGADIGVVFTDVWGDPFVPDRVSEAFDRRVQKSGLPRIRFHDLRHTHASHLLKAGVNIKIVSRRLGHASVSFTLDKYSHLMPDDDQQAALAVAALVDTAAQ